MRNHEWRVCRDGNDRCEEGDNGEDGEKNVRDADARLHWENSRVSTAVEQGEEEMKTN